MRQFLLALVAVVIFAGAAGAQTTSTSTSSSTSTSTSTTLILSWACTRDFSTVQMDHYEVDGHCVGTGAYQSGGAPLGSAATATATAQALCGSGNKTLVDFVKTDHPASGVPPALCTLSDAFVYQCATTVGSEMSTSNVTPSPFHFIAACK